MLSDETQSLNYARLAVDRFNSASKLWMQEKGKQFRDGRKDSADFTRYLLAHIGKDINLDDKIKFVGKVLLIRFDRNDRYYGFIECLPENIFFSEYDNPNITPNYENKMVKYNIREYNGKKRGIDVTLIDE